MPGFFSVALAFVDLSACAAVGAASWSAALPFKGRFYLGSTGSPRRAGLVKLSTRPPLPGLNASSGVDCSNLGVGTLNGMGNTNGTGLDAIGAIGDRLYVASSLSWHRSITDDPLGSQGWVEVTPSAPAYAARPSASSAQLTGILPADRGVSHFAAFGTGFFAGRNTAAGPQLWGCPQAPCDAASWRLVAGNSSGDLLLSQFNNPQLGAITLVEASAQFLYVGFDSPQGFHLFRTANPNATARADFVGEGSCDASQHPSTCAPLGLAGLGDSGNRSLFSATPYQRPQSSGLILAVGGAGQPMHIYRVDD